MHTPLDCLFPLNELSEVLRDSIRDFECRGCREMGIARRCLRLDMTEKATDDGKALAESDAA